MKKRMFVHFLIISIVLVGTVAVASKPDRNYLAVVTVPLVDVAGEPISQIDRKKITDYYDECSIAPDKGKFSCIRMHQLKYNEIVTVVGDDGTTPEVACEVRNLFYIKSGHKKLNIFWLLKKHLVPLSELKKKCDKMVIPNPIDMRQSPHEYNADVLTIILPWLDERTGRWYCPGTRFMRHAQEDTPNKYAFFLVDYETFSIQTAYVSRRSALVTYPETAQKKRRLFVSILKKWAHQKKGTIPYVYGGCTFTRVCNGPFCLVKRKQNGARISFWHREGKESPLSGFDCSGMLLTAAQIAGLPYYLKNTATLSRFLPVLKRGEALQEGDLVWYSGHVLVVSNVEKNLLIEAAGYEAGYGKVHEIHVSKVFGGISDLASLTQAYHSQKFLKRLNSKGKPFRSVYRLKLLHLNQ